MNMIQDQTAEFGQWQFKLFRVLFTVSLFNQKIYRPAKSQH